jgi:hypothetical protein
MSTDRPAQVVSGRIAVLNDIHGNLPALEAVLAEVCAAGVDRIVVGGESFSSLAVYDSGEGVALTADGDAERIIIRNATDRFFATLGGRGSSLGGSRERRAHPGSERLVRRRTAEVADSDRTPAIPRHTFS